MELKDIKTLRDVSEEYNVPLQTLHSRLKFLNEDIEYKKLGNGKRQPVILTPEGVKKIILKYTK